MVRNSGKMCHNFTRRLLEMGYVGTMYKVMTSNFEVLQICTFWFYWWNGLHMRKRQADMATTSERTRTLKGDSHLKLTLG